jgi:hypothetical protein
MYKRRDSLAILFDLNVRMVDKLLREIEACKRYPKDAVMRDRGYVLADVDVFQDYLKNRRLLKSESGSKCLDPYQRNNLRYLNAVN